MKRLTGSLVFLLCFLPVVGHAKGPKRILKREKSSLSVTPPEGVGPDIPRYEFTSLLGMAVASAAALDVGSRFAYRIYRERRLYVGPELNFSLYSPGSVFATLAGFWYESPLTRDNKLLLSWGLAVGPGFTTQLNDLSTTVMVAMGEVALSQELDDLVSIRGQLRSGCVGHWLTTMMTFNVSFRFF